MYKRYINSIIIIIIIIIIFNTSRGGEERSLKPVNWRLLIHGRVQNSVKYNTTRELGILHCTKEIAYLKGICRTGVDRESYAPIGNKKSIS